MTEKNAAVKANTLFTGDNLYILHGMNSESIDLIYLDPPFNSKRMYEAPVGSKAAGASFKDMWTWKDVDKFHLEKLFNNYPFMANFIATVVGIHGEVMMSYLTFKTHMCQRIIEMHRVLKDTGSLYLHCDPTASHYLKIILDRIFGKDNIVGMITWKRHSSIQKGSHFDIIYASKKLFGYQVQEDIFLRVKRNFFAVERSLTSAYWTPQLIHCFELCLKSNHSRYIK